MKFRIILLLLAVSFVLPTVSFSQSDYPVPANFRLKKKDDFKLHEKDFLNCVEWLSTHPVSTSEQYSLVTRFAHTWCQGTPYVEMLLTSLVTGGLEEESHMYFSFLNGWAKYVIETGDNDTFAGYWAGINFALDMYENPKCAYKKGPYWDKIAAARKDGTLKAMVENELKPSEKKK